MKTCLSIVLLTFLLSGCAFEVVDAGRRGVRVKNGKVNMEAGSLEEGFHWKAPFIESIKELNVRVIKWSDKTTSYTKDVQQAAINFTINYRLRPDSAHTTFKHVGSEWADVLLPQIVLGNLKTVIGQYKAVDLIAKRDEATEKIKEAVRSAAIEADIVVTNFELNNIDYSDEFESAVEAKVTAIEKAKESENLKVKAKHDKARAILKAEGEAMAIKITAQALKLNRDLIILEAVKKWNGKTPDIMVMGKTAALPFLNLKR